MAPLPISSAQAPDLISKKEYKTILKANTILVQDSLGISKKAARRVAEREVSKDFSIMTKAEESRRKEEFRTELYEAGKVDGEQVISKSALNKIVKEYNVSELSEDLLGYYQDVIAKKKGKTIGPVNKKGKVDFGWWKKW